jgi:hypothetical protein
VKCCTGENKLLNCYYISVSLSFISSRSVAEEEEHEEEEEEEKELVEEEEVR